MPTHVQALADHIVANRTRLPHMLWRDNSPQHFDLPHGEFPHPDQAQALLWGPGKTACKPIVGVELAPDGAITGSDAHVASGGWRNLISDPIMAAAGVPVHRTWNNTIMMAGGHGAGDCTHWCTPGAQALWIWSLTASMQALLGETSPS